MSRSYQNVKSFIEIDHIREVVAYLQVRKSAIYIDAFFEVFTVIQPSHSQV